MPCRALLLSSSLLLLLLLLFLGSVRASGAESSPHLPAPKDVVIYSYNFRSLLRWSPVKVDRGLVLYTVHFKTGTFNHWDEVNCTRITQTECSLPWSLKQRRWTIFLRVRAELGQVTSDWVETDPFVAERNTTIGPPTVNTMNASPNSLLIRVTPPFGFEMGDFFHYRVSYWENETSATKEEMKTRNTLFKIENLKESTLYCFRIQVELMMHSGFLLLGLQSAPECHKTTISEATRGQYVTLFVLALFFVMLVILGLFFLWKHRKALKYWSQPPLEIPPHFEEYLKDPSVPGLDALVNYVEDDPHDSLSILFCGEESHACGSSLDVQGHSRSISSESEVT